MHESGRCCVRVLYYFPVVYGGVVDICFCFNLPLIYCLFRNVYNFAEYGESFL